MELLNIYLKGLMIIFSSKKNEVIWEPKIDDSFPSKFSFHLLLFSIFITTDPTYCSQQWGSEL